MSFASTIKSELCRLELGPSCCARAELAALIVTNGNLQLTSPQRVQLNIVTEHACIARRLYKLFKQEFGFTPVILARKKVRLRKNISFLVKVAEAELAEAVIRQLGVIGDQGPGQHGAAVLGTRQCCRRAYLRGCFLAGGSISNPETNGYHLEIATEMQFHGENVRSLLQELGIKSGIVPRKQQQVVYIKDSDHIALFLSTIGSIQGRLSFENSRVFKDMRNRINRLVNCETANVNKTVDAAQRQVAAIRRLAATRGIESLSPGLRQVARLRMEFPEATLEELGQAANPPLSKSAINYRLRRLEELAGAGKTPPDKRRQL
jgi:hypothetical protein